MLTDLPLPRPSPHNISKQNPLRSSLHYLLATLVCHYPVKRKQMWTSNNLMHTRHNKLEGKGHQISGSHLKATISTRWKLDCSSPQHKVPDEGLPAWILDESLLNCLSNTKVSLNSNLHLLFCSQNSPQVWLAVLSAARWRNRKDCQECCYLQSSPVQHITHT